MAQQAIAEKAFGKDSRGSSGEGAMAVATVTLLQFITNDLLSHRVYFDNRARFVALGIQRAAAVRAMLWPRQRLLLGDLIVGNIAPPVAAMSGFGSPPTLLVFRARLGFQGYFGRVSCLANPPLFSISF